ncbi:MAG: ATP-binding cassette protein [Bacilli bacterium]|nr:ATP-binding cassette protein [Bacilli bacterium]
MEKVLEISGLTKRYRNNRGIQQVSMDVYKGDIYGFFGPNGAGKTTVMKIITGLCRADQGEIRILGLDVCTQFEQAMRNVGTLIELPDAFEYLSGEQNLRMAARFYPELPKSRVEEVLDWVGLTHCKREKVGHYSLGMKQRLGLAAAILSKPKLVILDEPTNGLDFEGMVEIRDLIVSLARDQQLTFLIASHLIREMEVICNRIGLLYEGKIIRQGLMSDLLQNTDAGPPQSLESFFLQAVQAERGALHA